VLETGTRAIGEGCEEGEPRLELTTAEVRQVFALYSRPLQAMQSATQRAREATPAPIGAWLEELLPLAWKWRRTLAQTSIAALALGGIFLLLATPTFAVTALVLVEPRSAAWESAAAQVENSAFLAGQAEIVSGAANVRGAVVRSGLAGVRAPEGWLARAVAWLPRSPREPEEIERVAVARAIDAFSAKPVPGARVIALEYRTQDPAAGVRFVQAVIDGYAELAGALQRDALGVAVRTLAAPSRQPSPLWPRPLPVLLSSLALGLLAGLALAVRAERTLAPEPRWTEIREAAWAA